MRDRLRGLPLWAWAPVFLAAVLGSWMVTLIAVDLVAFAVGVTVPNLVATLLMWAILGSAAHYFIGFDVLASDVRRVRALFAGRHS